MNTLHWSITIHASKEKVWDAMLQEATYREWTNVFNPAGSYFKGDWSRGSKMLFLGVDPETGKAESGMYSRIAENRPYEFVSIEHLGEIRDGVEKPWEGSENGFENYTLKEADGKTEVFIEMTGIPNEYLQMMNDMWPKALDKLKEIAERSG